MPKPISEQIIVDVENALRSITILAGYRFDADVERVEPESPAAERDSAVLMMPSSPTVRGDAVSNQSDVDWQLDFEIVATRIKSENDATPMESLLHDSFSDIIRAVMHDGTRGGLAIDTTLTGAEILDPGPGAVVGYVIVRFGVWYRTLRNNPYQQ